MKNKKALNLEYLEYHDKLNDAYYKGGKYLGKKLKRKEFNNIHQFLWLEHEIELIDNAHIIDKALDDDVEISKKAKLKDKTKAIKDKGYNIDKKRISNVLDMGH